MTQAGPLLLTRKAPAKLNLRLRVGAKNSSPLHTILSVVVDLDLADEVQFFGSEGGFAVTCDDQRSAAENLVDRASRALGRSLPAVRVHVRKRIPLQAGLGGGSADAAAALLGIAHLLAAHGSPVPTHQVEAAAAQTGSDVTACLHPGLKIVAGTGNKVRPQSGSLPDWGIVLLKPAASMATAEAYELLDSVRAHSTADQLVRALPDAAESQLAETMCAAVLRAKFERFCTLMHNDFQDVVERAHPEIAAARQRLAAAGAAATILCGSGSCVAGFFETAVAARAGADGLRLRPGEWSAVTRMDSSG